jgi:hypothetical protein
MTDKWSSWKVPTGLSGWSTPGTESELLRALPAGSLNVEQVRA